MGEPHIIDNRLTQDEFQKLTEGRNFIKIVIDIKREIVAFDGEMHVDGEQLLLEHGSSQKDLWGANIFPQKSGPEKLEYSSLINIRPRDGNKDMILRDEHLKKKVKTVISKLLPL